MWFINTWQWETRSIISSKLKSLLYIKILHYILIINKTLSMCQQFATLHVTQPARDVYILFNPIAVGIDICSLCQSFRPPHSSLPPSCGHYSSRPTFAFLFIESVTVIRTISHPYNLLKRLQPPIIIIHAIANISLNWPLRDTITLTYLLAALIVGYAQWLLGTQSLLHISWGIM